MPAKKSTAPRRRSRSHGAASSAPPPLRRPQISFADAPGTRVYVRVRPRAPQLSEDSIIQQSPDSRLLSMVNGKTWRFDGILYDDCTQMQVYQRCVEQPLQGALTGKTAAVMCYGQSGAGKTFTMKGNPTTPGIVARVATALFSAFSSLPEYSATVTTSYIQIYMGKAKDLLSTTPERDLLYQVQNERVHFPDLSVHTVTSDKLLVQLYDKGDGHKLIRSSPISAESARGHSILILNISLTPLNNPSAAQHGRLLLVDLAGYEPVSAVDHSSVAVIQETRHINHSLVNLHRTIAALTRGDSEIRCRGCLLSMLLRDAFAPQNVSSVIIAIHAVAAFKAQTYMSLSFGRSIMPSEATAPITDRPTRLDCEVIKNRVVENLTKAHALVHWLKKTDPKELKRFEAQHGRLDAADLSVKKVAETFSNIDALLAIDDDPPSGYAHPVQGAMVRLWAAFAEQKRVDRLEFERELLILQSQQAQEILTWQQLGMDNASCERLLQEHQLETQLRLGVGQEHQLFLWQQLATDLQAVMLRTAAQYKLLTERAEACLLSTTAAIDIQQLFELCQDESLVPHVQLNVQQPPQQPSQPENDLGGSVPLVSIASLAQHHQALVNLMQSAPVQPTQTARDEDADDVGFSSGLDETNVYQQELDDIDAYLGTPAPAVEPQPQNQNHSAQASTPGQPDAQSAPPPLSPLQSPAGAAAQPPRPALALGEDRSSLLVEVKGTATIEKTVRDLLNAAIGISEQAGSPNLVHDLLTMHGKEQQQAGQGHAKAESGPLSAAGERSPFRVMQGPETPKQVVQVPQSPAFFGRPSTPPSARSSQMSAVTYTSQHGPTYVMRSPVSPSPATVVGGYASPAGIPLGFQVPLPYNGPPAFSYLYR